MHAQESYLLPISFNVENYRQIRKTSTPTAPVRDILFPLQPAPAKRAALVVLALALLALRRVLRTTGTYGEVLGQVTIKSTLARHGCLHAVGPFVNLRRIEEVDVNEHTGRVFIYYSVIQIIPHLVPTKI